METITRVCLIIPALDEENSLPRVLREISRDAVDEIIVVDNGSVDRTAAVACACGALVVSEPHRGYGAACLAGLAAADPADIFVFMDGDYSDNPCELPLIIDPLVSGQADLVIGSRILGSRERGALLPQARLGNAMAAAMIRLLFGQTITDLGPFRGITSEALRFLGPTDTGFGFPVQTQSRAIARGLRVMEVPVSYRRRIGRSKISGTFRGTALAGWAILSTIVLEYLHRREDRWHTHRSSGEGSSLPCAIAGETSGDLQRYPNRATGEEGRS